MVLTIKNFGNPVGPGVTETAPTNLVGVAGTLKATLTWTSATGESGVVWTEEKLVRKEGSAPQGSMDGTTVATITTKNTYASTGYEDTGLDSTKTYYYKVFAVYDNGTERGSSDVNVTPQHPAPIIIESDLTNSTLESLIADGWTGIDSSRGYVLDSNGLKSVADDVRLYKEVSDIQYEIDNIEIETIFYIASGSWSGFSASGISGNVLNRSNGVFSRIHGNNNSGHNGIVCSYALSSRNVFLFTDRNNVPSGTYTNKMKINLKTGVVILDLLSNGISKFHGEGTITSEDLDIIKEFKYFFAEITKGQPVGNNNAIKYTKLTINF